MDSRRRFLKKTGIVALAGLATPLFSFSKISNNAFLSEGLTDESNAFTLPPLPYPYDALEPHIDRMTMEIHHTKHHMAYVNNLNKALSTAKVENVKLEDLLANISKYDIAVRNNAGGHWNHSFFWKIMKPNGGEASGNILELINTTFGSMENFKSKFNETAMKRFGSGWAWLYMDNSKKLAISSTPNQDNPLMDVSEVKGTPIMAIDVWEHAYYLKYQNKRADYVNAWWNILNWKEINENLALAQKM